MIRQRRAALPAPVALPFAFAGFLLSGVVVVAGAGRFGAGSALVAASVLVAVLTFCAEPAANPFVAVIGWFTVAAFNRPPYADLHGGGTWPAAVLLALIAGAATIAGSTFRRRTGRVIALEHVTLDLMNAPAVHKLDALRSPAGQTRRQRGVSRRRAVGGFVTGAILLPGLTGVLVAARSHVALVDLILLYLVVVIAVTIVGGFWPAVVAAVAAACLINWYFTPPLHTWGIDAPQNILALLLFVTVAVTVSSVVHLAARRDALARERAADATELSRLAGTVLGGSDDPAAVLAYLLRSRGLAAELSERRGDGRDGWVRVAAAGERTDRAHAVPAGRDLRLSVYGDVSGVSPAVIDGFAAQAAAALERQRLRITAGQAEALAAGNRMRTALLAAVSHDLRTPLASVKAAVSTLRQTDVQWEPADEAALLATIEEGADRLDSLIGNLLDMSRIQTGALQPFLRATALEEVVPLLAGGAGIRIEIPDDLPLLRTDPGLLERALDNIATNAQRYSPPDRPAVLSASVNGQLMVIEIADHGRGIPEQARQRIFEPFQQLDDHHSGEGVGLGLAVARGFIEALGGRIAAAPTPGGGLTMRVELPIGEPLLRRSEALL